MSVRRMSTQAMAELRQDLQRRSDEGAGVAELLDQVQQLTRRRASLRHERVTRVQFDELCRYCWSLQQSKPNGLLWGRARELWGERTALRTTRLGSGAERRASLRSRP
jgi:hypothetical protein